MIDRLQKFLKTKMRRNNFSFAYLVRRFLGAFPLLMTCQEFNDFIYDYVEGNLTKKQLRMFKRNMRVCPMCRNFLKTYMASYKAGKVIFPYEDIEVPSEVPKELLEAIKEIRRSSAIGSIVPKSQIPNSEC